MEKLIVELEAATEEEIQEWLDRRCRVRTHGPYTFSLKLIKRILWLENVVESRNKESAFWRGLWSEVPMKTRKKIIEKRMQRG